MDGDAIRADMGELLAEPAMKAAIVGFGDGGDRVLEASNTCVSRTAMRDAPQVLGSTASPTSG